MSDHSQMSFVPPRTRPMIRESHVAGWGGGRSSVDIFMHNEHVRSAPGVAARVEQETRTARPGTASGARRTAAPFATHTAGGNECVPGNHASGHRGRDPDRNASFEMNEVLAGRHTNDAEHHAKRHFDEQAWGAHIGSGMLPQNGCEAVERQGRARVEGPWVPQSDSIVMGENGFMGSPDRRPATASRLDPSMRGTPAGVPLQRPGEASRAPFGRDDQPHDNAAAIAARRKQQAFATSPQLFVQGSRRSPDALNIFHVSEQKQRELTGTRSLTDAEQTFRPGRGVTESMRNNMRGSGDVIGGEQSPPDRLPGGVKLGGQSSRASQIVLG